MSDQTSFRSCAAFVLSALSLALLWTAPAAAQSSRAWSVSALPATVRLDPVDGSIIDDRPDIYEMDAMGNLLDGNWVYDGDAVDLHGARGEYVSFQVVVSRHQETPLENIIVEVAPFTDGRRSFEVDPELFLEWSVEVKHVSDGYAKASLGHGWYPDALIPLDVIQMDTSHANTYGRVTYPLQIPDFHNRIDDQRHLIVWVDQYVPHARAAAPPGVYESQVTVTVEGQEKTLPVRLKVWDFALPNENALGNNLQMSGFLRRQDEDQELAVYQLFKRNRVGLTDGSYRPGITIRNDGTVDLDWTAFDARLEKYLTGEAFTEAYGYTDGPGYGEPIRNYLMPFDVFGKHGTRGWPDIGEADVEREPARRATYVDAVKKFRSHILEMVDPDKTKLIAYLNGLDESYFPEAWARMVYYGDLFDEYFPESAFRVDGGYSDEAMDVIAGSIDLWASHTINYNRDKIERNRARGVQDWVYGPLIYESRVNSWVGSGTFTDLPMINDRALTWAVWKYRTPSWIQWGIGSQWRKAWYDPSTWKDLSKDVNGNALLVYSPGIVPNVDVPSPAIRLKAMRDGVEDYEYFRLLSQLDGGEQRADAIVDDLIGEPWGDASIGNLNPWSYDVRRYDEARVRLGEMIEAAVKAHGSR